MRLHKLATLTVATLIMSALGACGGGDSGRPLSSGPLGGSSNGTLTVNTGTTTLPAGSYGLDTSEPGSSGTEQLQGRTLEVVLPQGTSANIGAGILFMQGDTSKFIIGLTDGASVNEDGYGCHSASWTSSELGALATLLDDETILSTAVCPTNVVVSIDAARHRIQFNRLALRGIDTPSKSITIGMDLSWTLQTGSPLTTSIPIASGSTSTTSGATITSSLPVSR